MHVTYGNNDKGNIIMDKAIKTYISVLKAEIAHLKTLLEPHDTGHIHTTIGTLQHRVKELEATDK